jgi:hypothetical protein
MMDRVTKQLPTPMEDGHELPEHQAMAAVTMPTILRAAVRMFPEAKVLTEESCEFDVAIEIEGVTYNCSTSANNAIDVIFVVDNGYVSVRGAYSS